MVQGVMLRKRRGLAEARSRGESLNALIPMRAYPSGGGWPAGGQRLDDLPMVD